MGPSAQVATYASTTVVKSMLQKSAYTYCLYSIRKREDCHQRLSSALEMSWCLFPSGGDVYWRVVTIDIYIVNNHYCSAP